MNLKVNALSVADEFQRYHSTVLSCIALFSCGCLFNVNKILDVEKEMRGNLLGWKDFFSQGFHIGVIENFLTCDYLVSPC